MTAEDRKWLSSWAARVGTRRLPTAWIAMDAHRTFDILETERPQVSEMRDAFVQAALEVHGMAPNVESWKQVKCG